MKKVLKIALVAPAAALMFVIDVPPELPPTGVELVPEAHAIFGVRRRSFRRGVVVGASVGAASAASASAAETSQQQSATAQQQPATAQEQSATAQQQSAAVQQPGSALPMGTVVSALPSGCTTMQASGTEYYHCGANDYRAAFQGNNLVYVTTEPQ